MGKLERFTLIYCVDEAQSRHQYRRGRRKSFLDQRIHIRPLYKLRMFLCDAIVQTERIVLFPLSETAQHDSSSIHQLTFNWLPSVRVCSMRTGPESWSIARRQLRPHTFLPFYLWHYLYHVKQTGRDEREQSVGTSWEEGKRQSKVLSFVVCEMEELLAFAEFAEVNQRTRIDWDMERWRKCHRSQSARLVQSSCRIVHSAH